ncbi:hypothetical protein ABDJ41_20265 [Pedobacter sp. ASV1-7]|uniref:hypothetical protein n=1 Tax=Pedobacter sp. ASV1-7 TaxID=3145237 RepID=UPI0032E8A9B2
MQNVGLFLTKIQTFDLRIITKGEEQKQAYSIIHETPYYNSFSYKSETRVLKDTALIDLLSQEVKFLDHYKQTVTKLPIM